MYTVKIVTFQSVDHPLRQYDLWINAFMGVIDLAREYKAPSFLTPNLPTFQARVEHAGALVATYDNVSGWRFN